MNRKKLTGSLSELTVAQDLMRKGYQVFLPLGEADCDIIVLKNSIESKYNELPIRVEVKTSARKCEIEQISKHDRLVTVVHINGDSIIDYNGWKP